MMQQQLLLKRGGLLIGAVLLGFSTVFAQKITVRGTVRDAAGNTEMPGVNVVVKGKATGVITDANGSYSIQIDNPADTLVFSFVGYVTQRIGVDGRSTIDVTMTEEVQKLEEVVVVGYGTQKKSDLTGAVSVVRTENLERIKSNDISRLLQGQASGVMVQSSGEPGAAPVVRIRGVGSFTNSSPLYVVDGVVIAEPQAFGGQFQGATPSGGIADFNPGDIESIQVLKDASATAIYGARGANGVIIITTKRGKKGDIQVSYDGSYGVKQLNKYMKVTNRKQFQEMNNLARLNDDLFPAPANDSTSAYYIDSIDTDWQKEAFTRGYVTEHSLTFMGGKDNSTYMLNLNYYDEKGIIVGPGPSYTRYSVRVNTDHKKGKLKIGNSFYYAYSHQRKLTNSQWENTVIGLVISIPTVPVYDSRMKGGYGGGIDTIHDQIAGNIVGFNNLKRLWLNRSRFIGSVYGEYELLPGLNYRLNLSYDRSEFFNHEFIPEFAIGSRHVNTIAFLDETRGENPYAIMEHTLTYNKEIGKHAFTLMAGYTAQYDYYRDLYGYAQGYKEPYQEVLYAGSSEKRTTDGHLYEHTMISYLGRLNYSWNDMLLLTANFRRDGSSRFGPGNKWGNFPSVSAGFKLSNLEFFKNISYLNLLKIRAGYGITGNDKIGDYLYETSVNKNAGYVLGGQLAPGTIQTQFVDQSIKWEKRISKNIGIDVAMFNNRLEFSGEYYYNDARDLLVNSPIPMSTGKIADPVTNLASMTNQGIELSLTYRKKEGDFQYELNGNITTLKNKVTRLGQNNDPIITSFSKTEVGHSMGELYGWVFEGIFQTDDEINKYAPGNAKYDPNKHAFQNRSTKPGDVKFKDLNNDGIIDDNDKTYLGVAFPKFTYGINTTFGYKNVELSIFFQGSYGNKAFNGVYAALNSYKEGNYSLESYENYWRGPGSTNKYPRLTKTDPNQNNRVSDRFIQDASYLKVQNIQLAYNFPAKVTRPLHVQALRVYVSSQNFLTFTKYTGYDPDFANDGLLYRGLDGGSFPNPTTYLAGVKVTF